MTGYLKPHSHMRSSVALQMLNSLFWFIEVLVHRNRHCTDSVAEHDCVDLKIESSFKVDSPADVN